MQYLKPLSSETALTVTCVVTSRLVFVLNYFFVFLPNILFSGHLIISLGADRCMHFDGSF